MKTNKFMLMLTLVASLVVMACDMYDDGVPSKAVRSEFKASYPQARDVEWDREGLNWSVSYEIGTYPNVVEYETLYDANGKWLMTENDVRLADVPEKIKAALAASEFGSLPLDDHEVEYYQTSKGNFYRFDLERNGRDIDVDVAESGTVTLARRDWF